MKELTQSDLDNYLYIRKLKELKRTSKDTRVLKFFRGYYLRTGVILC